MAPVTDRKAALVSLVAMLTSVTALGIALVLLWNGLFSATRTKPLTDIEYYRTALEAVAAGRPLFEVLGYPPFALIPILPLSWFPLLLAEQLWTAISLVGVVLLAALVVWLARRVPGRTVALPGTAGAVTSTALAAFLLLFSNPVLSQLFTGQISLLVMGLAFVDACGLLPKRLQGSLIGIAGAIKLTPMIFVPYFLITGQRRQAVTSSVSFLVATGIGFVLYPSDSLDFWTHLGSTTRFGDLARPDNLSMLGTLTRWVADPTVARYSWYALFVVIGSIGLLRARSHFRRGEVVEAALVVGSASVALSPIAWPHHQLWLAVILIWLLWTPKTLSRVLGAALLVPYSIGWVALYGAPFSFDLATFAIWEPRALIPVVICITGLPRNLARESARGGDDPSKASSRPSLSGAA